MSGTAPRISGSPPQSHAFVLTRRIEEVLPPLLFGLRMWASISLALYVALLVAAFAMLFSGAAGASPARIAIAACFTALVLHTWVYADFLEDPLTWTLLGIGVALAARPDRLSGRCSAI